MKTSPIYRRKRLLNLQQWPAWERDRDGKVEKRYRLKRERERHIGRERKEEQAGKELVDICAELEGGDGHPRVQCRIKRSRGPAEIDASRGSSLIYAFITVNNASPFASGLSLSLSRQSTPFHLVCTEAGYHSTPRPFRRVTIIPTRGGFF